MSISILLIEDDENHTALVKYAFKSDQSFELKTASTLSDAHLIINQKGLDLVIADIFLPDGSAIEFLESPDVNNVLPVICMTSQGDERMAVDCIKSGALDFVVKSEETFAALPYIAKQALREWQLIIEKNEGQAKIMEYQAQLRTLSSQLSMSEEKLKHNIAMGLHDQVGPLLSIASMLLSNIKTPNSKNDMESLEKVRNNINRAIEFTRTLTFELSPPILYELGLPPTIEWMLENNKNHNNINYTFSNDEHIKPIDNDFRTVLYQAVQELLLNIVKHAKATMINVCIAKENDQMIITITDNGVGYVVEDIKSQSSRKGFGLFNIEERINYLGGKVETLSKPNAGTTVKLIAKLSKELT